MEMEKQITPITVREMYDRQYRRAWNYYSCDSHYTDEDLSRASNIFAIKNTWKEYNKYLKRLKNETT